ncbi:ABC-2 type transport system permease protein [Saccharothrix ecbatanensis]|uniref:ABC-2 type transport system permease protein n=1 Tax=Saccharothrix ecbatanensis TaxID=1105145 RepID=A0A7W9HF99_9PSEU|nr:ABC transporter permease subunit [Saccharothrix ecbatanensis]MBB5801187.1 ABC-2 type transport system permease protein [Saccharothrix ecbatanensis]
MAAELIRKTLRDNRGNALGWGAVLVASVGLQLAVYPAVRDARGDLDRLLDAYPEAFKALFGVQGSFTSGVGYVQAEVFGFLAPLVLLGVAIGQAARATAAEERAGTLDLLLASPVSRTRVLADKALAIMVGLLGVAAALAGVLVVGSRVVGLDVPVSGLVAACASAAVVALPFGALALLVGAGTGRPGLAVAVPVGVALPAFLLDALSVLSDDLRPWRVLSPFHHAGIDDALAGRPDWGGLALLLLVTAVVLGAAVAVFQRHDVTR